MIRSPRTSLGWIARGALVLCIVLILVRFSLWNEFQPFQKPAPSQSFSPPARNESSTPPSTAHDDKPRPGSTPAMAEADRCAWLPKNDKILIIMKTGATEAYNRIPTQLMTTLSCMSDFLMFSDMEQNIAGVKIHDSLESVVAKAMDNNKDFDLYREQKDCPIDLASCNIGAGQASKGWDLDKYKNIHMAVKTYHMRPNYDWYIFVDADTYVLWPNMVEWLARFRSSSKRFFGSVAMVGNEPFGHGGSGYIVPHATMQDFVENNPDVTREFDDETRHTCCGDAMFAHALKNKTNVGVENAWPTINGEKPFTLPYGPTHWCHPIVTMHHLNPEEVSDFYRFERRFFEKKEASRPLLIKDIYHEFMAPRLVEKRDDWDNASDDVMYLDKDAKKYEDWQVDRAKKDDLSEVEKSAHKSFDDCRKMCSEVKECFQFKYSDDGICAYSKSFKIGAPQKPDDKKKRKMTAGWEVEKIHAWIEAQGECKKTLWPNL